MKQETSVTLWYTGQLLVALSIGAIFRLQLVKYASLYIMIFGIALTVSHLNTMFIYERIHRKITKTQKVLGRIGMVLLMLFLGIQVTIPFVNYIAILGVVMMGIGMIKK